MASTLEATLYSIEGAKLYESIGKVEYIQLSDRPRGIYMLSIDKVRFIKIVKE